MTHARGTSTVRKPTVATTARARAREAATNRAAEEKAERKEEIRRLKALKRKEVEIKLLKLVETAGTGAIGLEDIDLEGDWDGEEHDRKMAKAFGESYGGTVEDDFKPVWDDEIDITDIQGMESNSEVEEGGEEEEDEEMEEVEEKRVKGKKSKREAEGFPVELMEAARQGGGEERRLLLEKMVDDYYNLDYHDKVSHSRFLSSQRD